MAATLGDELPVDLFYWHRLLARRSTWKLRPGTIPGNSELSALWNEQSCWFSAAFHEKIETPNERDLLGRYMPRGQKPQPTEFSSFIMNRRAELGLSLRQLEHLTGLHNSRLSRWEKGIETPDRPERLIALAKGLQVLARDLYSLAGFDIPDELPSHRPYLRTKYGAALPTEALDDIAAYAEGVAARYGVTTGPVPGEDEQP